VQTNVVSYDIASLAVNLPSGFSLTGKDVEKVCKALLNALGTDLQ
jgi:dTDP-4-amino-4,6-dideoxygalactose transaminase